MPKPVITMSRASALAILAGMLLATAAAAEAGPAPTLSALLARPHVLFTSRDAAGGMLGVAKFGSVARVQVRTTVACEHVDFAGGRGLCLKTTRSKANPYVGFVFGADLKPTLRIRVPGNAISVRVRSDGLVAAYTIGAYVDRDEVTGPPPLTRVFFVNLSSGEGMPLDGFGLQAAFKSLPSTRLFSDVTFDAAHLNRFYASMSIGAKRYLVLGDYTRRTIKVVRRNVVLPSVSPDGRRLAYVTLGRHPRLSVLDLATGSSHTVTETRDVEDQPAWLDNRRLLYPVKRGKVDDLWVAPADGGGHPTRFLRGATSPSVVVQASVAP
jgi:hypothetical protein